MNGELSRLEDTLKQALCAGDEKQAKLLSLSKNFTLVNKAFDIQLTKPDFDYYRENASGFKTKELVEFIKKEAPGAKVKAAIPEDKADFDRRVSEIQEFFDLSFRRDEIFLLNIEKEMEKTGYRTAVLLTGGFHTDNLADLLRKEGYSYVTILPRFKDKEGYENPYFRILAGGEAPLGKTLADAVAASKLQVASIWNRLGPEVDGEKAQNSARIMVEIAKNLVSNNDAVVVVETPSGLKTIIFSMDKDGNVSFETRSAGPGDESLAVAKVTNKETLRYLDHDAVTDQQIKECFKKKNGKTAESVDVEVVESVLRFFESIGPKGKSIAKDIRERMMDPKVPPERRFQIVRLTGITGFKGHASWRGVYVDARLDPVVQAGVLVHEIGAFYGLKDEDNETLQKVYNEKFSRAGLKGDADAAAAAAGTATVSRIAEALDRNKALKHVGPAEDRDYYALQTQEDKGASAKPQTAMEKLKGAWANMKARFSGQEQAPLTAGTTAAPMTADNGRKEAKIKEMIARYLASDADVRRLLLEMDPAMMEALRKYLSGKEAAAPARESRIRRLVERKGIDRQAAEKQADEEISKRIKAKLNTQWALVMAGIIELGYSAGAAEKILEKFDGFFREIIKEKLGDKEAVLLRRPGAADNEDPIGLTGLSMYAYEVNDPALGKELVLKFPRTEEFLKQKDVTHGVQVYGVSQTEKNTGEKLRNYRERLDELMARGMTEKEANRELDRQAIQAIAQAYELARNKLGDIFAPMVLTDLTLKIQVPVYDADKNMMRDENGRIITRTETKKIGPGEDIPYLIVQQRVAPVRNMFQDLEAAEEKAQNRAFDIMKELGELKRQGREQSDLAQTLRKEYGKATAELKEAQEGLAKLEQRTKEDQKVLLARMQEKGVMDKDSRNWRSNYGYNDRGELVGFDADNYAVAFDMSRINDGYSPGHVPESMFPGKNLAILGEEDIDDFSAEYPDTWAPVPAAFNVLLTDRLGVLLETLSGLRDEGAISELREKVRSGKAEEKDLVDLMKATMKIGLTTEPAAGILAEDALKVDISPEREAALKAMLEERGIVTGTDNGKVLLRALSRIDNVLREESSRPGIEGQKDEVLIRLIEKEGLKEQLILREKIYETILSHTDLIKAVAEGTSDESAIAKASADKGYTGADAQLFQTLLMSIVEEAKAGAVTAGGRYDRRVISEAIEKVTNLDSSAPALEELSKIVKPGPGTIGVSLSESVGGIEDTPEKAERAIDAEEEEEENAAALRKSLLRIRPKTPFLGDFPESGAGRLSADGRTLLITAPLSSGGTETKRLPIKLSNLPDNPPQEETMGYISKDPLTRRSTKGLAGALGIRSAGANILAPESKDDLRARVGVFVDPEKLEKFLESWTVLTIANNDYCPGYVDFDNRKIYVTDDIRTLARISPQIMPMLILGEAARTDAGRTPMKGLADALGMTGKTDAEAAFIIRGFSPERAKVVELARTEMRNAGKNFNNDTLQEFLAGREGAGEEAEEKGLSAEERALLGTGDFTRSQPTRGLLDEIYFGESRTNAQKVIDAVKKDDSSEVGRKKVAEALISMNYGSWVCFADGMGGFEMKNHLSNPIMDILRPEATKIFLKFARENGVFAFHFGMDEHAFIFPDTYGQAEVEKFFHNAMEEIWKEAKNKYILYRGAAEKGWGKTPPKAIKDEIDKINIEATMIPGTKKIVYVYDDALGEGSLLVPTELGGRLSRAVEVSGASEVEQYPFIFPTGATKARARIKGEEFDFNQLVTKAEEQVEKWTADKAAEYIKKRGVENAWRDMVGGNADIEAALRMNAWENLSPKERKDAIDEAESAFEVPEELKERAREARSADEEAAAKTALEKASAGLEARKASVDIEEEAAGKLSKELVLMRGLPGLTTELVRALEVAPEEIEKASKEKEEKKIQLQDLVADADELLGERMSMSIENGARIERIFKEAAEGKVPRRYENPDGSSVAKKANDLYTSFDDSAKEAITAEFLRLSPEEIKKMAPEDRVIMVRGPPVNFFLIVLNDDATVSVMHIDLMYHAENLSTATKELAAKKAKVIEKMKTGVGGRATDYFMSASLSEKDREINKMLMAEAFARFAAGHITRKQLNEELERLSAIRAFPHKAVNSLYTHDGADPFIIAHGVKLYQAFQQYVREASVSGSGVSINKEVVGGILEKAHAEASKSFSPEKWERALGIPLVEVMYEVQMVNIKSPGISEEKIKEKLNEGFFMLGAMGMVRDPGLASQEALITKNCEARVREPIEKSKEEYRKAYKVAMEDRRARGEKGTKIKTMYMRGRMAQTWKNVQEKMSRHKIKKMFEAGGEVLGNVTNMNAPLVVYMQCKGDPLKEKDKSRQDLAAKAVREVAKKYNVDKSNIRIIFYTDKKDLYAKTNKEALGAEKSEIEQGKAEGKIIGAEREAEITLALNTLDLLEKNKEARAVVFSIAGSNVHPKKEGMGKSEPDATGKLPKDLFAKYNPRGGEKVYYVEENFEGLAKGEVPDPLLGPHLAWALGIKEFKAGNRDPDFIGSLDMLLFELSNTGMEFKNTAEIVEFMSSILDLGTPFMIKKLDFETFREQIKAEEAALKSL